MKKSMAIIAVLLAAGAGIAFAADEIIAFPDSPPVLPAFATGDTIFSEDWEWGQGTWNIDVNSCWQIGATSGDSPDVYRGLNCAGTILGGYYPESSGGYLRKNDLVLPPLDSPDEKIRLWFAQWTNCHLSGQDYGCVKVDAGTGMVEISERQAYYTSGWRWGMVDLTAYAGSTIDLGLFFQSVDTNYGGDSAQGWYVDDLYILKGEIPAPPVPEEFSADQGDWHATHGNWLIAQPTAGPGAGYRDDQCLSYSPWGNHPESTVSYFVSPAWSVPSLGTGADVSIKYHAWISTHSTSDFYRVEASINGGEWTPIDGPFSGSSSGWVARTATIDGCAGNKLQIRFYYQGVDTNYGGDSYFGVSIDHIYFGGLGLLAHNLTPSPLSYAVATTSTVRIDCSDPFNRTTINAASFQVTGSESGPHTGSFAFSPDNLSCIFTPATPFAEDEIVTCRLTDDVLDMHGLALDGDGNLMPGNDLVWEFSTGDLPFSATATSPAGLTAIVEGDDVLLDWIANAPEELVTEYRIYRAAPPADYSLLAIVDHPTTTYVDTAGSAGSQYNYYVTANNSMGRESQASEVVCGTPGDITAPAAPATPTIHPGDRVILISWATPQADVSCDVTSYVINCTPAGGTAAAIDTIPSLPLPWHTYTDSVPNYVEHCYTVQALDNAGLLGAHSGQICASAQGPRADLHLTKLVDASVPDIGAQVTFTLELTNDGPDATVNAVVTDLLPEDLTFVSASSADYGALTGEWLVGTLAEGATATLEIVATVDAAGDTIRNRATVVDEGTTDLDPTDNEATAWVLGRACDLRLVKTVDHDDPSVGDEIVFKVVVANLGPDTATGVEVVDALQPGLTYLRVVKSTGTYIGELWRIGSMAAGRTDSMMIYARVDEPGIVTNSAVASAASPPDLDPSNNADEATIAGRSADLVLTMSASPIGPEVGEPVTVTVTIHNDGPSAADDVVVIDAIPAGLIELDVDWPAGSAFADSTWTIDHLAVNQTLELVISAEMNTEDPLTNTARITASSLSDPDPNNDAAFVTLSTDPADLWVNKYVDRPTVSVGDTVTFTVVLGNGGPSAAAGIRLLDSAAPGLTFVSADASHGGYEMGNGVWSVAALAAGATDTLLIRAVVDQALTIENTATLVGAQQADPVPGNNSVSTAVTGLSADLALIATVSGSYNPRPAVGEIVTLNMLVRNVGPSTAEQVRVAAPLPVQLELQGTVPDDGSYDFVSGHWDVGTLAPGASKNMALSVEVLAAEPMRFTCGIDTSSVPDPWGDNDASEITFYMVDADLAIDKSVSSAAPALNMNVTYTLTVTNNGPDDVSEVTVGDVLPAEVTFVSATASTGAYAGGVWTVGDLADGISETLAIVVTVDELGEITNVAQITGSTGLDDDLSDNSDFVDMHPIDPAPTIVIGGPYGVAAGDPVTVTAVVSDNTGVTDVTLHYRAGSATSFTNVAMTPAVGVNAWQGVIPGSVTGHRGVACYVSAHDAAGGEGFSELATVTVDVAEVTSPLAQPGGSTQSAYRMIAMPLDLADPDPAAVLEDDLGPYDREKWRLFSLNATQIWDNAEFPNCGDMTPGRGFFLIVGEAGHVIDTGPGTTVPLDEPFAVNLQAGWNLVGNPFNFDVPMANLAIESSGDLDVRDYQGSWGELSGTSNLAPFRGYLVAAAADNDRLLIDPVGDMNKRLPVEAPVPAWELALIATVGEARDDDNAVSVYEDAADGPDRFDRPEPPALGGYVSVSFPHGDWDGPFEHFCKDARPAAAEGWTWELEVRTNVEGLVTLDWDGLESLPDDWQVWLRDELLMINVDMREAADYTFVGAHESQSARSFRLVVGSEDYIATALPASESVPAVLTLKSNFPNPFNPATTIRYGVPREGRVELGVYDVRGRLVARLVDEVKPAGYHAVVWEGRNSDGEGVASGTYLCRVIAGGEVRTEKMLLIK